MIAGEQIPIVFVEPATPEGKTDQWGYAVFKSSKTTKIINSMGPIMLTGVFKGQKIPVQEFVGQK